MVISKKWGDNIYDKRNVFPILEFDNENKAKINPTHLMEREFEFNKLIITFFPGVINKLLDEIMIDNYYT